jgi:hypothetical protein
MEPLVLIYKSTVELLVKPLGGERDTRGLLGKILERLWQAAGKPLANNPVIYTHSPPVPVKFYLRAARALLPQPLNMGLL